MRYLKTLFATLPLAIASMAVSDIRDAAACGGCFVSQTENTQVTGHRMILSVSNDKTTLWDQIKYAGNPESFAWVLPIKGQVEIGLSSDALFAQLEQRTQVIINSPSLSCPPCGGGSGGGGGSAGAGPGGGVTVIAQEVVGPYETVQLSAADPLALKTWLTDHGYSIPDDVKPLIDTYVAEGFDFLALKLVPGQDVSSMRPVRITTPGASPALPLRMVAAGTGAITSVTLWVVGEGRYEPANFAWFQIDPNALVWNWDTSSSNYKDLREAGFAATNGHGWLVDFSMSVWPWEISDPLQSLVTFSPLQSGYGDAMGIGAEAELVADMDALHGAFNPMFVWITRLQAELPRAALSKDLALGASIVQGTVSPWFNVTQTVGTPPECPCGDWGDAGGAGGAGGGNGGGPPGEEDNPFWEPNSAQGGGWQSCAHGSGVGSSAVFGGLSLAVGLGLGLRRRRRHRILKKG